MKNQKSVNKIYYVEKKVFDHNSFLDHFCFIFTIGSIGIIFAELLTRLINDPPSRFSDVPELICIELTVIILAVAVAFLINPGTRIEEAINVREVLT